MKRTQFITIVIVSAIIGGLVGILAYSALAGKNRPSVLSPAREPASVVKLTAAMDTATDFTLAAENTVHGVVHIKTESTVTYTNPFRDFFGDRFPNFEQPVTAYGSGVIISADGYIVTNNHVIENSKAISVVLNDKREFEARLVGADENTDLALLKIDAENLPSIPFGNSDNVKVGEWVLAVGNPYNITSTVTAGIVSAKGRNMDIIDTEYQIESFIQTDAPVNQGNSGGALVNLKGEMIGITTAIASSTGGNVGISFAIPSTLVKKVVEDLREFGSVQRAFMGVSIDEINATTAKQYNLDNLEGVYVLEVNDNSAAKEAGIQKGDVIMRINNVRVNSPSELQELVGRNRPGDKITVEVKRDGKLKQFEVTLRNLEGNTSIVRSDTGSMSATLGATFANVTENEKRNLGIQNGVKVEKLQDGKLKSAGIQEGFIITKVNEQSVNSVSELNNLLRSIKGGVYIEGKYPNGRTAYYAFGM